MVNQSLLLLLLLASLGSFDVAHEAEARRIFARLLAEGHYGCSHIERAAFLVRDRHGRISAIDWPEAAGADSAEWEGAFPPGVVAIVHTHPNWLPRPSKIDSATARRSGVPVYVITRTEIWKTTGEASAAIAGAPIGQSGRACPSIPETPMTLAAARGESTPVPEGVGAEPAAAGAVGWLRDGPPGEGGVPVHGPRCTILFHHGLLPDEVPQADVCGGGAGGRSWRADRAGACFSAGDRGVVR